jgi:hypothetical protein
VTGGSRQTWLICSNVKPSGCLAAMSNEQVPVASL